MSLRNLLNWLARHPDQLDRMMDALGLRSAVEALPDSANVLQRAADRCQSCEHAERCAAWLDANAKADEAPRYCRNHALFQRVSRGCDGRAR